MREIKFRYVFKGTEPFIKHYTIEEIEHYDCDISDIASVSEIIARDQYTGLKDKNGVEIYEGDILALSNTTANSTIVSVIHKDASFVLDGTQTDIYGEMYLHEVAHDIEVDSASHYCEVIGNIYENKELL